MGGNVGTILLTRDPERLCFDVRNQHCIVYSTIRDLEAKLTHEIRQLTGAPSA